MGDELSLKNESFLSVSANIISIGLTFILIALLSRTIGLEGVGIYYFIIAISKIIGRPLKGVSNVVRKRSSEKGSKDSEILGVWALFTVGYVLIIVAMTTPLIDIIVRNTVLTKETIMMPILFMSAGTFVGTSLNYYDAVKSPGQSRVIGVSRKAVFIVLLLIFHNSLKIPLNASIALLINIGLMIAYGLVVFTFLRTAPITPSSETFKNMKEFGRWSVPAGIFATVTGRLPVLVLGVLVGSSAVGIFEGAFQLTEIGPLVAVSVNDILMVKVSRKTSVGDDVGEEITKAMSYTTLLSIPVLSGAVMFGEELVRFVLTPKFIPVAEILGLIAIARILYSVWGPLVYAIQGADKPRFMFYIHGTRLLITLPAITLLTILYGIEGTVAGFILSHIIPTIGGLIVSYKLFPDLSFPTPILYQIISSVAIGGFFYSLTTAISPLSKNQIAMAIIIATIIYIGLLSILDPNFRKSIKRSLISS